MAQLERKTILLFQKKILTWYETHQRDLPWRKTRNPYYILVSEIMLQQTQVNRVIPKFEAWLQSFPTVATLANAPVSEVLAHWSGLGYNRRALNLKKAAIVVNEVHNGTFPQTEKELLALPGIGPYTARAVLCFAFDKQVAVVDTNVRKIILTQFGQTKLNDKQILAFAEDLLPQDKAYEWNQALMDYASAVLKKEKIPVPKQSKFYGSHRYFRGQILKALLDKKSLSMTELGEIIKKDFAQTEQTWLEALVAELTQEGFVVVKKNKIQLPS